MNTLDTTLEENLQKAFDLIREKSEHKNSWGGTDPRWYISRAQEQVKSLRLDMAQYEDEIKKLRRLLTDADLKQRDVFAAAALSNPELMVGSITADAQSAYQYADAMMKARTEETK